MEFRTGERLIPGPSPEEKGVGEGLGVEGVGVWGCGGGVKGVGARGVKDVRGCGWRARVR